MTQFPFSAIVAMEGQFFDKETYPLRRVTAKDQVRVVPGGSSIRDGCYIGRGVTCMPPMYINVGSYISLCGSDSQVILQDERAAAAMAGFPGGINTKINGC